MALKIADFPKENKKGCIISTSCGQGCIISTSCGQKAISSVVKSVDYQGHHLFNVEEFQCSLDHPGMKYYTAVLVLTHISLLLPKTSNNF